MYNSYMPEPVTKKGRFSAEEDKLLKELVKAERNKTWKEIAANFPGRTAAQCRDRYNQYLFKEIQHKPWTTQEDMKIVQLYKQYGPRWVKIAEHFPGRNGNNIKNRWNSVLKTFHGISYKMTKQVRRSKKEKWAESQMEANEEPEIIPQKDPPLKLPSIMLTIKSLESLPRSMCMPVNMYVPSMNC